MFKKSWIIWISTRKTCLSGWFVWISPHRIGLVSTLTNRSRQAGRIVSADAVHVQRIMEKAYASGEELKIMKI